MSYNTFGTVIPLALQLVCPHQLRYALAPAAEIVDLVRELAVDINMQVPCRRNGFTEVRCNSYYQSHQVCKSQAELVLNVARNLK